MSSPQGFKAGDIVEHFESGMRIEVVASLPSKNLIKVWAGSGRKYPAFYNADDFFLVCSVARPCQDLMAGAQLAGKDAVHS